MKKNHEKLLIASLAGLVITAAAAFAVQPAMAAGYNVGAEAEVTGVKSWDVLNVRRWPAPYSKKVGELEPGEDVYVERCIVMKTGSDWCLVEGDGAYGWVNARYLTLDEDFDDDDDI
jgi:uncharacterized protein YraI